MRRLAIALGAAAAVLAIVTVGAVIANGSDTPDDGAAPEFVATAAPETTGAYDGGAGEATPTEVATTDSIDPDQEALDELARIHGEDRASVTFEGQYVAQLASKTPGISDPYQTAADGTHVFRAPDILAEHRRLRDGANGTATVVLVQSTDYGKRQLYQGQPLWVTVALGDFPTKQAVDDWCAQRFPELTGDERGNQCAARRLRP
jgi:hypothetical protein